VGRSGLEYGHKSKGKDRAYKSEREAFDAAITALKKLIYKEKML